MEKERNYGIDLLKIIAMLMIVIIHTQGHGGILFSGILPYTQETFSTLIMLPHYSLKALFSLQLTVTHSLLAMLIGIEKLDTIN